MMKSWTGKSRNLGWWRDTRRTGRRDETEEKEERRKEDALLDRIERKGKRPEPVTRHS